VGPAVLRGEALFPEDHLDPLDLRPPRRSKPLICAVQGYCLTIGVELLLAADIRLAAQGTRLAQMEVSRGIIPFGGGTLRWPRIAGWGNAMRYLLTGDPFDAEEAYRLGIVQQVVEPASLLKEAITLGEHLCEQAPLAVQQARLAARISMEQGWQEACEALLRQTRELMQTKDAQEGVLSFVERRKAKFQGK
jgi:enoyl-CoA hydratase/carnithine racemase